jgi:hypothetical protein
MKNNTSDLYEYLDSDKKVYPSWLVGKENKGKFKERQKQVELELNGNLTNSFSNELHIINV